MHIYLLYMIACAITGKDIIIFVTPEDHKTPSTVTLSDDVESEPGILFLALILVFETE